MTIDTPIVDTPIVDTPIVDTPIVDTPIVDTPIVDTPIVDTPIINTPVKPTTPQTISLSMIVKDESHCILRVLESVYKHIDHWVIVDTGSTDGTQDIIKNFFTEKNVPGELIEHEWTNFSDARNLCLEAVEKVTDYGIWIDADEELIPLPNFNLKIALNEGFDTISVPTRYGGVDYTRKSIWKCGIGFKWTGPIHEILESPNEKTGGILHGAHVFVRAEGNSWKDIKGKYAAHAVILSKYTEENKDPRWLFYTAQSYRDAGDHQNSFDWYKKRAECTENGFAEEIFFSRFMMARLSEIMGYDKLQICALYNEAHKSDPVRGEAIKGLIQYLQRTGEWEQAYIYSQYGTRYNGKNPYPNRILFIDNALYQFQMLEIHAHSCFYTNRKEEGSKAYWQMRSQIKPDMVNEMQMKIILENEKHFLPLSTIASLSQQSLPQPQRQNPTRGSNFSPPKKKRKR